MKVKLLKKIRKEFTITYYPKGYISRSAYHYEEYDGERMVLTFSKNRFFEEILTINNTPKSGGEKTYTKEGAYKELLTTIQTMVHKKYAPLMKRKPNKGVKLFYNK